MKSHQLYLVGFMGAGKSTVGRLVAERLARPFVDLDEEIERCEGRSVAEIFAADSESGFRAAEARALEEVAAGPSAVVATGGGVVLDERNRTLMRRTGTVVYLRVSAATAVARCGEASGRPLLDAGEPLSRAEELLDGRRSVYEEAADHAFDTESSTPEEIADRVAAAVMDPGETGFTLHVGTVPSYDVRIGPRALDHAGAVVSGLGVRRAVLLTDETVGGLYGDRVADSLSAAGVEIERIAVPAGEGSKSWDRAGRVLSEMTRARLDRRCALVALGGGVVGDLGGFCASVYMRGIAVVHVPTTLLAQVDSSLGGKTGIDLPAGKNLIGTFWQPSAVLGDTDCLQTLQETEWRSGLAEVAKSAVLAGEGALSELEADAGALASREPAAVLRAVRMAAGLKAGVVAGDERESGDRESLNLGHTFGHALETVLGYGEIPHGHAVAEGMRFAARLAGRVLGTEAAVIGRQERLLHSLGLPALRLDADPEALMRAMAADKKARGGEIRFVLIRLPGEWSSVTVPPEVLSEELHAHVRRSKGEGER